MSYSVLLCIIHGSRHFCKLLDVEDFPRVEDVVGIEGLLDGFHHFQFARIGKFLHQVLALIADAVFAGQAAAVGIDELVQFLLVGLDPLVPVFIGGIFVLEDVQVDIAVAGMAGDAGDQVIFLGQAKDFIEEGCFLVDRDDDVFFADDEAFGTDGFGKGLAGLPNLVVVGDEN